MYSRVPSEPDRWHQTHPYLDGRLWVCCHHLCHKEQCLFCGNVDPVPVCRYTRDRHDFEDAVQVTDTATHLCETCKTYPDPFAHLEWDDRVASYDGVPFFESIGHTEVDLHRMMFHLMQLHRDTLQAQITELKQTVQTLVDMIEFHPDGAEAEEAVKRIKKNLEK